MKFHAGDFIDLSMAPPSVSPRGLWDVMLPSSAGRPVPTPVKFDRFIGLNACGYLITADSACMFGSDRQGFSVSVIHEGRIRTAVAITPRKKELNS